MSLILAAVQARGAAKIHLTPQEVHALWRLAQWLGRSFWHLTTWVQCLLAGVPSVAGLIWLHRWEALPMATPAQVARWRKEEIRGSRRRGIE